MHRKMPIFGLVVPLNILSLHKIGIQQKVHKSHVIKF
jgi:hypothetical protein